MDRLKKAIDDMIDLLPDWVDEKEPFMLLNGKQLVFEKKPHKKARIKIETCNHCGECCLDFPAVPFGTDDEGKCNRLKKEGDRWMCTAGSNTPKKCLSDPDPRSMKELGCSIKYIK